MLPTPPTSAAPGVAAPPHRFTNCGILGEWYRSLGVQQKVQFARDTATAGWDMNQFWLDAAPGQRLGELPFWRLDWYRAWFHQFGQLRGLFDESRCETIGTAQTPPGWKPYAPDQHLE